MTREDLRQLGILLRPLKVRIANMVARAVVQVINDATKMQELQIGVQDGEDVDEAERFQNYGFTSVPKPGAEAAVVFPNGDHGHPLVIAVDDRRYRLKGMQPGEVAIYTDESGHVIKLLRGKVTVIAGSEIKLGSDAAATKVALKTDLDALKAAISGAAVVPNDGGATFKANILAALSSWPVCSAKVKAE